jgi:hypothetical protein
MANRPAVTILLPVHNGAQYLRQAIDSVLAQDFHDFELRILDDDSGDESPRLVQEFSDSRIRYSRNPQRFGLFRTLNRGFSEADTSLVRLWAQDDVMLPGSLGKFVRFAEGHPTAGLVYSDFMGIDAAGKPTGIEHRFIEQRRRTPALAGSKLSALLMWTYGCLPGNISTTILRREAWAGVGGFLVGKQQAPDFDMWVRVSERWDVGFLSERLVGLRDHPGQLSRVGQREMTTIEEELPVLHMLERRLDGVLTSDQVRSGWIQGRGSEHVQWAARALLRGDLSAALRGMRAIAAYGRPVRQVAFWLASANGRWLRPDRNKAFDRAVHRIFDTTGMAQ